METEGRFAGERSRKPRQMVLDDIFACRKDGSSGRNGCLNKKCNWSRPTLYTRSLGRPTLLVMLVVCCSREATSYAKGGRLRMVGWWR